MQSPSMSAASPITILPTILSFLTLRHLTTVGTTSITPNHNRQRPSFHKCCSSALTPPMQDSPALSRRDKDWENRRHCETANGCEMKLVSQRRGFWCFTLL